MGSGAGAQVRDGEDYPLSPVRVRDGRLFLVNWHTEDTDIVSFFENRPEADRISVFDRVVKIGVDASRAAGTIERIDYVQKEFALLQTQFVNQLDRTLAQLQSKFDEVFAEKGRFARTLDETFGEKGKVLREIFDPARQGTPLNQLRQDFLNELSRLRQEVVVTKQVAQLEEKTPIGGLQFEDEVEKLLSKIVSYHKGDRLERTSTTTGMFGHSKKGDFLVRLAENPNAPIAIDAKKRASISETEIKQVLEESIKTRGAAYAILVAKSANAFPASVGWFNEYDGQGLVCALGESTPEEIREEILGIALGWARTRIALQATNAFNDSATIETAVVKVKVAIDRLKDILTQCDNLGTATDRIRMLCSGITNEVMDQLRTIMPASKRLGNR